MSIVRMSLKLCEVPSVWRCRLPLQLQSYLLIEQTAAAVVKQEETQATRIPEPVRNNKRSCQAKVNISDKAVKMHEVT